MAEERIQKILARAGVTSRRKAEAIILAGRVRVDGKVVTELGAKANPKKVQVELDGRRLEPEPLCYGILHKPRGMVTTLSDPEGRPTAQDILRRVGVRVVPVGRLDFNTTGALLFTNDGDFAQVLQHASGNAPKVYAAKVTTLIDERALAAWRQSIEIEGKRTRPAEVRILRREGDKTWLEVTISEGKNHQVRRLGEHAKTPVERLARLSHAGIGTEGLRPGQWRFLTVDELKELKKRFGVPNKVRPPLELDRRDVKARPKAFRVSAEKAPERTSGAKATGRASGVRQDERRAVTKAGAPSKSGASFKSGAAPKAGAASKSGAASKFGAASKSGVPKNSAPGSKAGGRSKAGAQGNSRSRGPAGPAPGMRAAKAGAGRRPTSNSAGASARRPKKRR